jgi:hypothetical protein
MFEHYAAMNEAYMEFFPGLKPMCPHFRNLNVRVANLILGTDLCCGVGSTFWCCGGDRVHCATLIDVARVEEDGIIYIVSNCIIIPSPELVLTYVGQLTVS